jgi:hypothetical protein
MIDINSLLFQTRNKTLSLKKLFFEELERDTEVHYFEDFLKEFSQEIEELLDLAPNSVRTFAETMNNEKISIRVGFDFINILGEVERNKVGFEIKSSGDVEFPSLNVLVFGPLYQGPPEEFLDTMVSTSFLRDNIEFFVDTIVKNIGNTLIEETTLTATTNDTTRKQVFYPIISGVNAGLGLVNNYKPLGGSPNVIGDMERNRVIHIKLQLPKPAMPLNSQQAKTLLNFDLVYYIKDEKTGEAKKQVDSFNFIFTPPEDEDIRVKLFHSEGNYVELYNIGKELGEKILREYTDEAKRLLA